MRQRLRWGSRRSGGALGRICLLSAPGQGCTSSVGRLVMAWAEKIAQHAWRVRHRRDDGQVESIYGFTTAEAAIQVAGMVTGHRCCSSQPARSSTGVITLDDWVSCWWPTLDLDTRTL